MPAWFKLLLACLFSLLLVLLALAGMGNPDEQPQARLDLNHHEAEQEERYALEHHEQRLGQVIAPLLHTPPPIFEDMLPEPLPDDAANKVSSASGTGVAESIEYLPRQKLALVIDDVGYDLNALKRLLALPFTITVAILPDSPHAEEAAQLAHEHGATVMLHMPMQTSNPKYQQNMERFYLHKNMTHAEFNHVFEAALAKVPYVQGVNNHMGSLLTSDAKAMQWLMALCAKHHLFFLDSRTSSTSVAAKEAKAQGLAWRQRDVFLDHQTDRASLVTAWNAALDCMLTNDQCVMIGHPHEETVAFLEMHKNKLQSTLFVSIQAMLK